MTPRRISVVALGRPRDRDIYPDRHGCPEERAALALDAAQQQHAAAQQAESDRRQQLRRAGLTGQISAFTFAHFLPRADWPEAMNICQRVFDYVQAVISGSTDRPWLLLYGNFGTGKTHLAAAAVHYALDAGWSDACFRVWTSYVYRLQATIDRRRQVEDEFGHETIADIMSELKRGRFVVIDDIDKQPPSDWTQANLYDVLNTRYNAARPTVLTFNLAPDDPRTQDRLGGAAFDRMMHLAYDIVEFAGPSFRLSEAA
jgi:DNA replication protein DnaC